MNSYIERRLKEKATDELSILNSQWNFDKELVPRALQAIVTTFPHYSMHDISHSECILDNVTKLLGESAIDEMTCTDLWLLLEAAYYHDIGMVVTADMLDEALKDDSFKEYARDYIEKVENGSCPFDLDGNEIKIKDGTLLNSETYNSIQFLLSGYFRKYHADNSKRAILNPDSFLSLKSPRVDILSRLYNSLADICCSHTKDFDYVMSMLPQHENGVSTENAHPRFIACLLRLGDLLDTDNSRFNDTLLRTLRNLPEDSKAHYFKHHGVKHLFVDSHSVEITIYCDNPRVSSIVHEYYEWIKDEFRSQTLSWKDICPLSPDCVLPQKITLKVEMKDYFDFDRSSDNVFSMDMKKAMELIQGRNLYKNRFDSLRELIQNSVDASLIRMFEDYERKDYGGINDEFLSAAQQYPIYITLAPSKDGCINFTIDDNGIGINENTLHYLSKAGSSENNKEKSRVIEMMPEWMRPSGIFGIGFQSIFRLTDMVEVKTKDYYNNEKMWLEMYAPLSANKGDIYRRSTPFHRANVGTTMSFVMKGTGRPDIDKFGKIKDMVSKDIEENIYNYAKYSFFPIYLNGKLMTQRKAFSFYDKETKLELCFTMHQVKGKQKNFVLYRNVEVASPPNFSFPFLTFTVNLHCRTANEVLELNRDSLIQEFRNKYRRLINKSIINFINSPQYESVCIESVKRRDAHPFPLLFSLFASYKECRDQILDGRLEEIQEVELVKDIKLTELKKEPRITLSLVTLITSNYDKDKKSLYLNVHGYAPNKIESDRVKFFAKELLKSYKHCLAVGLKHVELGQTPEFVMYNDGDESTKISFEQLKSYAISSHTQRSYLYYVDGFDKIRISSEDCDPDIIGCHSLLLPDYPHYEKILSPFLKIRNEIYDCRNNEFYQYVLEHRANGVQDGNIAEIKAEYDRLVGEFKKHKLVFKDGTDIYV